MREEGILSQNKEKSSWTYYQTYRYFSFTFFQYEFGIIYNWLKHFKLAHLALQKDHLAGQCDSTRGTTSPQVATQHTVPL